MKKLLSIVMMTILCVCTFTSCGKTGHEDVLKEVENNTYTPPTVTDARLDTGWVIERQKISEVDKEILNLTKHIDDDNFTISQYIGYKVENNEIKYAFIGGDKDNKNCLKYVIQDTNNNITVIDGDYNDLDTIFMNLDNASSSDSN